MHTHHLDDQTLTLGDRETLEQWLTAIEHESARISLPSGLDRVRAVAQKMDLLNIAPYVITVAGTNGKGTTCRALEMILIEAGMRVGVYSSPHLFHYTERVRIQDKTVPQQDWVTAFVAITKIKQQLNLSLSYFEYATLAAFFLFKSTPLDVVILEVGLGGRLDATNVIDADVAILTTIGIDHIHYLGTTREAIGFEKAGIFKPQQVVIVGDKAIPHSVDRVAQDQHVLYHPCRPHPQGEWFYTETSSSTWSFTADSQTFEHLPIPSIPLQNAATALAALFYSDLTVSESALRQGLEKSALIGRFQCVSTAPYVILDVAHNPHAAHYLQQAIQKFKAQHPNTRSGQVHLVIGMLKDKAIDETLAALSADHWYLGTLSTPRGAQAQELASMLKTEVPVHCYPTISAAWQAAQTTAALNDIILVCGSFYTVSEVLSCLN